MVPRGGRAAHVSGRSWYRTGGQDVGGADDMHCANPLTNKQIVSSLLFLSTSPSSGLVLPEYPCDRGIEGGKELPEELSDHGIARGRQLPEFPSGHGIAEAQVVVAGHDGDRVVAQEASRGTLASFGYMGSGYGAPALGQLTISALAGVLHLHDPHSIPFSLLFPSLARHSLDDLIEVPGKHLQVDQRRTVSLLFRSFSLSGTPT